MLAIIMIGDMMNLKEELEDYKMFRKMMQPYRQAIEVMKMKLAGIDDELRCENGYSPIHNIQSRIKSPESILEKLERKHYLCQKDSLKKLHDIAGLRVVCHYINDIQYISQLLVMHDDIRLIKKMNYIDYPKETGYRSLHLVVEVPIYLKTGKMKLPVEIQMRTIAMDFWASLEHEILYKNQDDVPQEICEELRECADRMALTDLQMQRIYQKVYKKDG